MCFEKYNYAVGHRIVTEHLVELICSAAVWQSHISSEDIRSKSSISGFKPFLCHFSVWLIGILDPLSKVLIFCYSVYFD
jgi:hypothetical protein